jgi:2-oxoisovalerate dehydrogenase E2 component (dihydrolipoyl transacylase)
MGRYIVKLPDIGEGTTEAEIVKWHVTPGQEIREEAMSRRIATPRLFQLARPVPHALHPRSPSPQPSPRKRGEGV